MEYATSPSDIARETIRQLASRRMLPTPENYSRLYGEISGSNGGVVLGEAGQMLESLLPKLPGDQGVRLKQALERRDWKRVEGVLLDLVGQSYHGNTLTPRWADLIRGAIQGLETRHATLTAPRKRESLEHVLSAFSGDSRRLHERLTGLIKSWAEEPIESGVRDFARTTNSEYPSARQMATQPPAGSSDKTDVVILRELLASTLRYGIVERLGYSPGLSVEARRISDRVLDSGSHEALRSCAAELRQFWLRLELAGESQAELMGGLLGLIDLVLNNVGELVADDRWLNGQIDRMRQILGQPLNGKAIREAELQFREIVYKQGNLKHGLEHAKTALKDMLTVFIDRLGDAASNTSEFHSRIGHHAERIQKADDIAQLGQILDQVMTDTRVVQVDMLRARDELQDWRKQALEYEKRIGELQQELDAASVMMKEDPLTRLLNRRGFQEAWQVETARCLRQGVGLCVGLIDVDDFKLLNDSLGHVAGDDALIHLARIVRTTLRPSDVVARYGGEEFVILLPGIGLEEACSVLVRVQRELTRRFFMFNNARVLITFSAGVTARVGAEPEQTVVERADRALYAAKKAGKNRVIAFRE